MLVTAAAFSRTSDREGRETLAIDLARIRERRSRAVFGAPQPAGPGPAPAFDREYWLAHCEGFRVDAEAGRLGFVDEVRRDPDSGETVLVVRAGRLGTRLLLVPATAVSFIVPRELRLWLRTPELVSAEHLELPIADAETRRAV
jgi:hypothetical protein